MHLSVLLDEAIDALNIKPEGIYIDGTFGRGGHSQAILKQLNEHGKLIVFDQDPEAIEYAEKTFADENRVFIQHHAFSGMFNVVQKLELEQQVDGILLDLGVSSPQLDNAERGFSFMQSGELDMRMNTKQGLSAKEWINTVSLNEMATVFKEYGEERYAKRIAQAIIIAREQKAIVETLQLAEIIKQAHPRWEKHKHPATRCFQAIRIYINQELQELEDVLEQIVGILKPGGRMAIISFHSLEDRMVKRFIHKMTSGEELPFDVPIQYEEDKSEMKKIGKAIKPGQKELSQNPRARSAILRVAEKK